jgi:transposase
MAAVGDIRRLPDRRKLTAYLGLDPRVRQSGAGPANHGHISKQGSNSARHALVEACWSTVRQPGPIAAFYARVKAKRGHSIAIVACARKLACLFWCLLTRGEDYAFAQPPPTTKKMRRLELTAGPAPPERPRRLVDQHQDAHRRTRTRPPSPARLRTHRRRLASHSKVGRERDTGARIKRALEGPSRAADHKPLTSALRYVSHSRPPP